MNHYIYDEIAIGHTEAFTVVVTEEMVSGFYRITGDNNPLHSDDTFAQNSENGFLNKVVYGMLSASFLSTLAGVYLPGEKSLIHRVEVEFPAPVYVGDTLSFSGEVVRKDDNFNTIEIKVIARNSDGKKVLRGKMRVGVTK